MTVGPGEAARRKKAAQDAVDMLKSVVKTYPKIADDVTRVLLDMERQYVALLLSERDSVMISRSQGAIAVLQQLRGMFNAV